VKEPLLLLSVNRIVGGVEVEHDLFRRAVVCGQELLNQQRHLYQCLPARPILQPAQRGRRGQRIVLVWRFVGGIDQSDLPIRFPQLQYAGI